MQGSERQFILAISRQSDALPSNLASGIITRRSRGSCAWFIHSGKHKLLVSAAGRQACRRRTRRRQSWHLIFDVGRATRVCAPAADADISSGAICTYIRPASAAKGATRVSGNVPNCSCLMILPLVKGAPACAVRQFLVNTTLEAHRLCCKSLLGRDPVSVWAFSGVIKSATRGVDLNRLCRPSLACRAHSHRQIFFTYKHALQAVAKWARLAIASTAACYSQILSVTNRRTIFQRSLGRTHQAVPLLCPWSG